MNWKGNFAVGAVLVAMGATSGCTPQEISLTPEGKGVSLAESIGEVEACRLLGEIASSASTGFDFVGDIERIILAKARNKAGAMGGNRILAGRRLPGGREYKVYRCP